MTTFGRFPTPRDTTVITKAQVLARNTDGGLDLDFDGETSENVPTLAHVAVELGGWVHVLQGQWGALVIGTGEPEAAGTPHLIWSRPQTSNNILPSGVWVGLTQVHVVDANRMTLDADGYAIVPDTGWYHVSALGRLPSTGGGRRAIGLSISRAGGDANGLLSSEVIIPASSASWVAPQVSIPIGLNVGDGVRVRVYQDSGAALNTGDTYFTIVKTAPPPTPDYVFVPPPIILRPALPPELTE